MKVAILGASQDPERYSYKAFKMLKEHGHTPLPVSPNVKEVEGVKSVPTLTDLDDEIDTLTVYVRPEISSKLRDDILRIKPRRVIFNPGSENPTLQNELVNFGIKVEEACTLVLLRTGQF